MVSKKSRYCGEIENCPKCGKPGSLKERISDNGDKFFQVDHWVNPKWHGDGYLSSCYLRVVKPEEKRLNPRKSKDRKLIRKAVGVA